MFVWVKVPRLGPTVLYPRHPWLYGNFTPQHVHGTWRMVTLLTEVMRQRRDASAGRHVWRPAKLPGRDSRADRQSRCDP